MKKAYVVTKGEYSDYGIEGVFLDKALAERWATRVEGGVEEYKINSVPNEFRRKMKYYEIIMARNGDSKTPVESRFDSYIKSQKSRDFIQDIPLRIEWSHWPERGGEKLFICYCWARDEKHAI